MIKIFKNETELDYVKDTLSITKESNFLDNDFKIQSSTYPFLIIENQNTIDALGSRNVSSINREIYHDVTVVTPDGVYNGELQVLSYTNNYRKCNLRFFSPIYALKDIKIADFLPNRIYASLDPDYEVDFDYEEKRSSVWPPEKTQIWAEFSAEIIKKGFPETLFNLPTYKFPNKFGEDLAEDHDWYQYNGQINAYWWWEGVRYGEFNRYSINSVDGVVFHNVTVNAPQVYLLSPLYIAMQSIGYTLKGTFYNHPFIKRLLFYSEKNNLTEIKIETFVKDIEYTTGGWSPSDIFYTKAINFELTPAKKYRMDIKLKKKITGIVGARLKGEGVFNSINIEIFGTDSLDEELDYSITFSPPQDANFESHLEIELISTNNPATTEPLEILSWKIYEISDKTGYLSHPVINLQRYVPEWTFIDYLNELKKLFNLKITPDDHDKTLTLDFMADYFTNRKGVDFEGLNIQGYDTLENDSLLLTYDNTIDANVFVDKHSYNIGINQPALHTHEIRSKFKFIEINNNECIITEEVEDKSGVGLVIFEHGINKPTSPLKSYLGYSLDLENIYKKNHEVSFKNYLFSGVFEAKTFLNSQELKKILSNDFIISNEKRYYINNVKYKTTQTGVYETTLELLLMVY